MIKRGLSSLALVLCAASAAAQDAKAPAKQAPAPPPAAKATDAKAATKQQAADAKASASAPQAAATKGQAPATKTPTGTGRPGLAVAPEAAQRPRTPVILREVFEYEGEGRRDPFFSLLATAELRPTVADLKLIGILYDPSGRRSIVTLRDVTTNTRYQVTTGTTLGRMKVVLIKPKAIYFSIEEYGLNRQDSLVLRDTTKARER